MQSMSDVVESFSKINLQNISFMKAGVAVALALISIIAIKIIMSILDRFLKRSRIERSLHTFIKTFVRIVLYFVAILIVSEKLDIGITSFVTLFGVFGLAISLAFQGLLSNVAGGLTVLITKPFIVGNFVEIGDIKGSVVDIDFIYTKINAGDNKIISIPNAQITGAKIINYSMKENRRVDLEISASYEDDINKVKQTINDVINDNTMVLKEEPILVRVKEYKDSSISYVVRLWTKNENYWDVYFDIMEGIKERFDKNGISMPFNQLEVKIKKD